MRCLAACALLLMCFASHAQGGGFRFTAPSGTHAVGFRVVGQYDASRSYGVSGGARPIQTLIWYPAAASGKPMRYGDYLALSASEEHFDLDEAQREKRTEASLRPYRVLGTDAADIERIRGEAVGATRDASPSPGRFPVVIYAPSDSSSAFENDSLCEYLASHGYVVIASPSHGARARYMTDGRIPYDLESTRAQATDIGFLIGYAQTLPQADTAHVGVVGYSWGGMASMFAAIADRRIGALVDLDGSVRYFPDLFRAAPDIDPDRLATRLLFFADREDPIEPARDSLPKSFIARIHHADVIEIGLKRLFHQDLSAQSLRLGSMATHADTTAQQRNDSYAWVARYTLAFLDSALKADPAATAFLAATPAANHVPAGTLSLWRRAAVGSPASLEDLVSSLRTYPDVDSTAGFDAYLKAHPGFHVTDDMFSSWLTALLDAGDAGAATSWARLWTHAWPRSADAWTQRATIDDMAGDTDAALVNYRRALRFDPRQALALRRVQALREHVSTTHRSGE